MRSSGKKQKCVRDIAWGKGQRGKNAKCLQFLRNKRSKIDSKRVGPSRHIEESISDAEHTRHLATPSGLEPLSKEVFTYTQMRKYEGQAVVDHPSQSVVDDYNSLSEQHSAQQTDSGPDSSINEREIYLEDVDEGQRKRKVSVYYSHSSSASDSATSPLSAQDLAMKEQYREMKEQVEKQGEQIEQLKEILQAQIMRRLPRCPQVKEMAQNMQLLPSQPPVNSASGEDTKPTVANDTTGDVP
ncbi:hypothetical protein JCGZ_18581 [Jatropha curcas]|uniref:Uncharacterized protein n=1 Tax=Jatropha curcas TaxID=180498 RepID=A0A067KDS2_JATCU|nr:uncharacterized protein LOC105641404 [Jatropha curcas]XP_012081323.1 uncharacterized protein LOC105641404 [Jatropha curcas]XP_012081324.1 uncharacterized protein LOC105641404 [Jatropha curcas]KDP30009.1 hypothetical protein JCGZ_18581 [Jatropha curcas]